MVPLRMIDRPNTKSWDRRGTNTSLHTNISLYHSTNAVQYLKKIYLSIYVDIAVLFIGSYTCFYLSDIRTELTSKLTEPFLLVSKASNKKCAYILESAKAETCSNQRALNTRSKVFEQLGLAES